MTTQQATAWIQSLMAQIMTGEISRFDADAEVFAEMENGDHSANVETVLFNFTRGA